MLAETAFKHTSAIPAEDANTSSRGGEALSGSDTACVKPGLPRPARNAGLAMTASAGTAQQTLVVRHLDQQDYLTCWQAMQDFTNQRNEETLDELWLLEHPPVFTLGQSGKMEHVLRAGKIPIHQIDRGGQVTYHGPGQLIAYTLIDIKRKQLSIRQFVTQLEQSIIDLLAKEQIQAESRCKAPGVYVNNKKICSIGLRVRRGYAFHGLALNVAMDLEPFSRINPCGYAGLEMTQLSELQDSAKLPETGKKLVACLTKNLGYSETI